MIKLHAPNCLPVSGKCFVCEKELVLQHGSPIGGTIWKCHGNYGTEVYDTVGHRENVFLVAYLCDGCLLAGRAKVKERSIVIEQHVTEQDPNF